MLGPGPALWIGELAIGSFAHDIYNRHGNKNYCERELYLFRNIEMNIFAFDFSRILPLPHLLLILRHGLLFSAVIWLVGGAARLPGDI